MGVWADPFHDPRVAQQLKDILESDQELHPEKAADVLFNIVGDDDFHDMLGDIGREEPQADVRGVAADWVKRWLDKGDQTWMKPWKSEAVSITRDAVNKWIADHPDPYDVKP